MKKVISAVALSVAIFAAAGQAQASFGDEHLTQVFYTPDSNKIEIGVDLGAVGTNFQLTDQNKTLKTIDLSGIAATKGATVNELSMGMFVDSLVKTTDSLLDHYFMTVGNAVPTTPTLSGITTMNNAAGPVENYYNGTYNVSQLDNGTIAVADPSYANAYRTKMDQNNTAPGTYGTMNTANFPGELKLADMSKTDGKGLYEDVYLWHFGYDKAAKSVSLMKGASTDYAAVLRFYANGTTVLNPNAVPVPAAIWVLGSGLLGLVGLRRRQDS